MQVLTFTWIISYARIIVQAPQLEKNKTYLGQPGSIQKQTVAHQGLPFYLKIKKKRKEMSIEKPQEQKKRLAPPVFFLESKNRPV